MSYEIWHTFLLVSIVLCGCRNKMPTNFSNTDSVEIAFDCVEKLFPIPFYEKNTLRFEKYDFQAVTSGLVLDSLDNVREFFLVHADQEGWYLDCQMIFQDSFVLTFKKAKRTVVVVGHRCHGIHASVEVYIKS